MTKANAVKPGQVLLYCPKLPNEKSAKPLLVSTGMDEVVGQAMSASRSDDTAQNPNSTPNTSNKESEILNAWQTLIQTHNPDLEAQPAYKTLYHAKNNETLQLLSNTKIQSPKGLNLTTPAEALNWLALQYQQRNRLPKKLYAIGFKRFWRPTIETFCQGSELTHVRTAEQVPAGAKAITWSLKPLRTNEDVEVIRLEDGFLRSVGLGIQFARPLSWIPDRTGMYFNALQPSDLENLLNTKSFSDEELEQARELKDSIVKADITKYNTGDNSFQLPKDAEGKTSILVTGQVETDASIRFGAPGIQTNLELVKAVREANPEAYIVYKPHPDVVSKSRKTGNSEHKAKEYADIEITDASISQVMAAVDEVHVLTSLAGFEALLRHKPVTCYGVPFYVGWGLTCDMCSTSEANAAYARRQRTLSIEALVAGTLQDYPLYVSRENGYYSNAEQTLKELIAWREEPEPFTLKFKKLVRKLMNLLFGTK